MVEQTNHGRKQQREQNQFGCQAKCEGVNKAVELLNSKCGTGAASLTAPIGQSEVFEGVVDAEISALRSVWTARIFDSF